MRFRCKPTLRNGPMYGTPDDTTWCGLCHPSHAFGEVLATKIITWTCPVYGFRMQGACDFCIKVFASDLKGRTILKAIQ